MNPRRLYRCRHDRMLAGVAGGMAEYLQLDPTVVRILWLVSTLFGGITILLYIVLAFVMPLEPAVEGEAVAGGAGYAAGPAAGAAAAPTYWHNRPVEREPGRLGLIVGITLVVVGAIALADVAIPNLVAGPYIGPALLLALGVGLVVAAARRPAPAPAPTYETPASTGSYVDTDTTVAEQ